MPISSNTENLSLFCGTNISLPRYFDLSILMKPLSETMPTLLFVFTKVAEASDVVREAWGFIRNSPDFKNMTDFGKLVLLARILLLLRSEILYG